MKLEVGMWVRNCYGRIAKIQYIEDNIAYCDNWLYQQYEDHIDFINLDEEEDLNEIIKASHNIIDLIEVGDYVNGSKVHRVGNCLTIILDNEENISWINPNDIQSIVTKEQFSSIEYKVGE